MDQYDLEYHGARLNAVWERERQDKEFHAERLRNEQERGRLLLERQRPFHVVNAHLKLDGPDGPYKWVALKDDVRGYGNTPEEAAANFDRAWTGQLD